MASGKGGGYDCNFVEDPPGSLECPVCLLTLRDVQVMDCCGHQFCQPCIDSVRSQGKPCPMCGESSFSSFLHKGVQRMVKSLRVYCPQKDDGCEWTGELGSLEQHVSPSGTGGIRADDGCGYLEVECEHGCGERAQRRFMREHAMDTCTKRPLEVQLKSVVMQLAGVREETESLRSELTRVREDYEKALVTEREERERTISDVSSKLFAALKSATEINDSLDERLANAEEEMSQLRSKQTELERSGGETDSLVNRLESLLKKNKEEIAQHSLKTDSQVEEVGRLRSELALAGVFTRLLVWVDPRIGNGENTNYVRQLKKTDRLRLTATTDPSVALEVLLSQKPGTEYRAVTAGTGGEPFVRALRAAGIMCRVLVFCGNQALHSSWAVRFQDVQVTNSPAKFISFATWKS